MTKSPGKFPDSLVGREDEQARIAAAVASASAGHGRVLMFAGEPGIGKSTLARMAAGCAEAAAIPVYWGFAWEAGGAPAYWPWTQMLNSLIADRQPDAKLTMPLVQLLPGLEKNSASPQLRPDQARFMLLESVRRLLEKTAALQPLVIILEDLHAADSDSLHLLQYVAQHVANLPVLLIGTYRNVEARKMDDSDALWRTCRAADVIEVRRLDKSAVRAYLANHDRDSATDANAERLYAITEGNPLFLSALVGLLDQQIAAGANLPADVQQVIRQQIRLLPRDCQHLLGEASILGREFDVASLQAVTTAAQRDIAGMLQLAERAALLRQTDAAHFRFTHVLYRDVLYDDIGHSERSALHLRHATELERQADAGAADLWAELAAHYHQAGPDHRDRTVHAWRQAGKQAMRRLAFEESLRSFENALRSFGAGPRANPAERAALLLECAEAAMLGGKVTTGHGYCREAFEIASATHDPALMAVAALTWGGAIVVARVDADLVAALRTSLAALPQPEIALRARVQARLAGALQPAADPAGPMDMAREAIAAARTTDDDEVMHDVLRSAISALMDFAPVEERLALNREFDLLSEKLGDVPGQFRSKLRLVIDACEAADRSLMDRSIDQCARIAEKIGLPHYRWRVASIHAMQATIDGRFAAASDHLDTAERQAAAINDLEAGITLPLQRLMILIEWDSPRGRSLEDIEARIDDAYAAGMQDARAFVAPVIETYRERDPSTLADVMLSNREIIERRFLSGDRYSMCQICEIAAAVGEFELAQRAFDRNVPYAKQCAALGLMGSLCHGPVALSMGIVAVATKKWREAHELLNLALDVSRQMQAPPWEARVHMALADLADRENDAKSADDHRDAAAKLVAALQLRPVRTAPAKQVARPAPSRAPQEFSLARDGELWRVEWHGSTAMLKNSKGMELLAKLVGQPDTDLHVLDLSDTAAVRDEGAADLGLDAQARQAYSERIAGLREALDEAEQMGDAGRADTIREELDFITRELSRAFGLGGRARPSGRAAERARVNVRRRLKDAIERIAEQHPGAGRYLENTIKTGTYCKYVPM